MSEFNNYNDKLEKLLDFNDEDTRLVQQRETNAESKSIDRAICGFWKQAMKLFMALASAWNCRCAMHGAELMLQHRTTREAEFHVTFIRYEEAGLELCRTRISEGDEKIAAQLRKTVQILETTSFRQPDHRNLMPARSAMKSSTCVQVVK